MSGNQATQWYNSLHKNRLHTNLLLTMHACICVNSMSTVYLWKEPYKLIYSWHNKIKHTKSLPNCALALGKQDQVEPEEAMVLVLH